MTAIIGFAGPGYGLLAVDRNIILRERILSSAGGKLHAGPGGFFAGAGKAQLLAAVARTVMTTTEPAAVARAMRAERKTRYAKRASTSARPETSFGVLLRSGPEAWVLRPDEGYRPQRVPAGRPLVTGPEDPAMRPLVGAFRLLFTPTPGESSFAHNVDLLHLYFWLRHRLDPLISSDFDLAVVSPERSEASTHANAFDADPSRVAEMAVYLSELGEAFTLLGKLVGGA